MLVREQVVVGTETSGVSVLRQKLDERNLSFIPLRLAAWFARNHCFFTGRPFSVRRTNVDSLTVFFSRSQSRTRRPLISLLLRTAVISKNAIMTRSRPVDRRRSSNTCSSVNGCRSSVALYFGRSRCGIGLVVHHWRETPNLNTRLSSSKTRFTT